MTSGKELHSNDYSPGITNPDISRLLKLACQAAKEAGKAILEIYQSGSFEVISKADDSPLTKADQAAHDIIFRHLATTNLPILSEEGSQLPFEQRQKWDWYWLTDPLDGTKEFIQKNGEFTVNIALMKKDIPVAGVIFAPCLQTLYYGASGTGVYREAKGLKQKLLLLPEHQPFSEISGKEGIKVAVSRSHMNAATEQFIAQFRQPELLVMGSSLKLMLLAENKADVYPRFGQTMDWDLAAGDAILRALNRSIYSTDLQTPLKYNQPELCHPGFVAF